jgi:two-component system alkaline phosphatase synthesis response regulator PhoP
MTLNALLNQLRESDKPFYSKGEIINLVEKMIPKKDKIVENNGVVVDLEKYVISYKGKQTTFPKKITELTYYLITNPGRIVRRDEILNEVWGGDVLVGDRTIDVHISKIRRLINFDCIKTIKGVGYQWN